FEFAFNPQNITVTTGTIVRWINIGNVMHSSTSDTAVWARGILNPCQQFSFTFDTPGTYAYHCSVHPFMTAQVVVQSNDTPTPTPTPCVPSTVVDSIVDFAFNPQNITVRLGSSIRWTITGSVPHSSTSDTNI